MNVYDFKVASGACYEIGRLVTGEHQYIDRDYQFDYVPSELNNQLHIKTCGNDKLISENDVCFSFKCDTDIEICILFADKFPILPRWLNSFKKERLNVTRFDSSPNNLKGYFSIFRKRFSSGVITLNGCSPNIMLQQSWFLNTKGNNYCMYSVCIKETR